MTNKRKTQSYWHKGGEKVGRKLVGCVNHESGEI